MSTLWSDSAGCFAIEEVDDFTSVYEATEDEALDFSKCSDTR